MTPCRTDRPPRSAPTRIGALLAVCLLLLVPLFGAGSASRAAPGEVWVLSLDGAVTPATMDYLQRGIDRAGATGAALVIIEMDTPGGLMSATRELIKTILASPVPVVTYVTPSGARAASAGTYILLASHVAAMAPATHLGSATPVRMGGVPGLPDRRPGGESDAPAGDGDARRATPAQATGGDAMERKVLEDAVSYIRELAARHGRNADWAERAVREAANLGADEALADNVIDVVARDVGDLLERIDGRRVALAASEVTLDTAGLTVTRIAPDWRTRLLSVITDPNIAYLLLLLGFYGLVFELANPGSLFPGVIGATCLLLALFAFQVLSVNYAGLALILLGIGLIVAEAFAPSFGILGIGGIVAFVAGSVILMDGSHRAVSLPLIGGVGAVAAAFLTWVVRRFVHLRRRKPVYGAEHFAAEPAQAADTFSARNGAYHGHVRMSGERWRAVSDVPVSAGTTVRVIAVNGLTLTVGPVHGR